MLISICIPTYNRPEHLKNCLSSLACQTKKNFEVCVSDNNSTTNISRIINQFNTRIKIRFRKNKKNLGFAINLLNVSKMAKGKFIWFLGDDDLLVPDAIEQLTKRIKKNNKVEFFWINSYDLNYSHIKKFPSPFDTKNLPKKMISHSKLKQDEKLFFFDLIDKRISFDYLLGIYLCAFRTDKWNKNLHVINKSLIKDKKPWSNFENTCFFIKIFCEAFNNSKAYFCAKPLSVNLIGVREWSHLYPLIEIVRIPEAIDYYRSKGLNYYQYWINKNYALRNFFNYFVKIILNGDKMGLNYINFRKHFIMNLVYPYSWLSIVFFFKRKIINLFKAI